MAKKNLKYVAQGAKKNLKGVSIVATDEKDKYSTQRYIHIYKGYDILQNLLVTRTYIQKRYNIDWQGLELLLMLMGMRLFTISDYTSLPKDFRYSRFNNVRDRGWVQLVQNHTNPDKRVFGLSSQAKNIVVMFYKCLVGEVKIPERAKDNPMARTKDQKTFDKKKMNLIKKLNKLPVKEHIKRLYK